MYRDGGQAAAVVLCTAAPRFAASLRNASHREWRSTGWDASMPGAWLAPSAASAACEGVVYAIRR
jgi:hypothetical protein